MSGGIKFENVCNQWSDGTRTRRARAWFSVLTLCLSGLACGGTSAADATTDVDDASVGADIVSDIASDAASDGPSADAAPPPSEGGTPVPPVPGEWTQHAHDPQRSGYTPQMVPPPWRFRWQWFDREAADGEPGLARNVQPVTGGGRVYVARGARGVIALRASDGSVAWENRALEGSASATPAFHPATGTLLLTTTAGRLYQLDASTGGVVRLFSFDAPDPRIAYVGGAAPRIVSSLQRAGISFAPLLVGDTVFVSARRSVIALSTGDLRPRWTYDAASEVHTPAAYSESARVVVVATSDLHVHAIEAASGARRWRARPYDIARPDPEVQYLFGWPVIAEQHGVVLMKIRLSWALALTQWPTTIAAMRALITSRPELQSLHALSLTDGSQPFRPLVGHGGYGDGDYMPMGPQPVVRRDGATEVVYTVIRGDDTYDFRWDSRFGEMVLDDRTVTGLRAGDVRWIYFDPAGQNATWPRPFLLTDEQPYVSMAGDVLFGAHWAAGHALRIGDRGPSRGSFATPITSTSLPAVVESTTSCPASRSQYCAMGASLDGDGRVYGPSAFYLRHGAGAFYDRHWSEYATWIVSNDAVYFRSCSGTLLALESGDPTSVRGASEDGREDEAPASTPTTREASTTALGATSARDRDDPASLVVSPREARAYVGRHVTLEGVVSYVIDNGKALYFAFQRPHQGMPVVIVPRAAWTRFEGGPRSIAGPGDRLRVRGALRWYQGDPAMDLLDPAQIDRPSSSARSALR